jgi:hypothetical protein
MSVEQLKQLQSRQTASGLGKFGEMARQLPESKPVHLIVVTGGLIRDGDLDLLRGHAQSAQVKRIDIITLGDSDEDAAALVAEFDGQYIGLPDEIIDEWIGNAKGD